MEQCIGQTPSQVTAPELADPLPSSPKNNKDKFKSLMLNINQKVIKTLDKLKPNTIANTNTNTHTSPGISRSNSTEKKRVALPGRQQPTSVNHGLLEVNSLDTDGKSEEHYLYAIAFNASVVVALLAILWIGWHA